MQLTLSARLVSAGLVLACVLALVLGCSSTADSKASKRSSKSGGGEIRKISELPELYRETLRDYGTGGVIWSARRETVRQDPELRAFLVDNLILEAVRAFGAGRLADPTRGRGPYERAQRELNEFADEAAPLLAELLTKPDDLVALVADDTLAGMGELAIQPTIAKLGHDAWKVRLRVATLLGKLPHAKSSEDQVRAALVAVLEGDPEWVVRAQAARSLGQRGARDRVTEPTRVALARALRDEDLGVARRAAEALGVLGDPAAAGGLRRFLQRCTAEGSVEGVRITEAALRQVDPTR